MFFPRSFWVPPVLCGLLAAGCVSGAAWSVHRLADFQDDFDFGSHVSQETPKQDEAKSETAHDTEKSETSETNEQMARVEEIMRASAERTIRILSELDKS